MAEQVDLTAPDQKVDGTMNYGPEGLTISIPGATIILYMVSADGNYRKQIVWENALPMIRQINKANFSNKSLLNQLMQKAIADGKLIGSISGTPD